MQHDDASVQTMVVIDREDPMLSDHKTSLIQYIADHASDSFGLITYASGEFLLVLPATTNTQILTTYIQSISPAGKTPNAPTTYSLYNQTKSSFLVLSNNERVQKLFSDKTLTSLVS